MRNAKQMLTIVIVINLQNTYCEIRVANLVSNYFK